MSALALRQSVTSEHIFPKEATFQHLFFQGMMLNTRSNCSILPELSHIMQSLVAEGGSKSSRVMDFYINGDLKWGIELLIEGRNIREHLRRFLPNGKYACLIPADYIVVDFRGTNNSGLATNVVVNEGRAMVFFKTGDFSQCEVRCGLDLELVPITLRD
jgi:hypothetical protein